MRLSDYANAYVVGTCSLCGGPVYSARVIVNGQPDYDWCGKCGATTKQRVHGPVITMFPRSDQPWRPS